MKILSRYYSKLETLQQGELPLLTGSDGIVVLDDPSNIPAPDTNVLKRFT
jgi:hypothetical protein